MAGRLIAVTAALRVLLCCRTAASLDFVATSSARPAALLHGGATACILATTLVAFGTTTEFCLGRAARCVLPAAGHFLLAAV